MTQQMPGSPDPTPRDTSRPHGGHPTPAQQDGGTPPFWPTDEGAFALARACAKGDATALFALVDQQAIDALGHVLCTVNRLDEAHLRLFRLYSSNPKAYPAGGSKDKAGTPWGHHVLSQRRIFVGEGAQAIVQSFDDHDAIARLGLNSVINVPVVFADRCLGTVNFLMPGERVSGDMVHAAQRSALAALPGFLLALPN